MGEYKNLNEEILSILEEGELSTPEIHERLTAKGIEISSGALRQRLKQMILEGKVEARRLGKRILMWRLRRSD
ncbi:hypothetical protein J7L97_02575 [Candidatus Bathyarchaeota archaeon]|nr:hypothetical protein [Candidatus Bathyarchaeota archaeon]